MSKSRKRSPREAPSTSPPQSGADQDPGLDNSLLLERMESDEEDRLAGLAGTASEFAMETLYGNAESQKLLAD